jgi:hypothetical protein
MRWSGWLTIAVVMLAGCKQHPNPTNDARPAKEETGDNFHKKMECAKLGEKLEASEGKFVHRVFYSSKKDSCLAAKYTLYFGQTEKESAEITDILTGDTVWHLTYPCESRPTVNPDGTYSNPPTYELTCTRFYWEVQADLDRQITVLE